MFDIEIVNGGDQNDNSIPEGPIGSELMIELIDGFGDIIQYNLQASC